MKIKLFSDKYGASCKYCENGRINNTGETVFCEKKGFVEPNFSCKKYKYDPLKRIPNKKNYINDGISEKDFKI